MNPLKWKKEYQIALSIAVALGAFLGWLYGLQNVDWMFHHHYWFDYWLAVGKWSALGALIGGALIYVWQLLRT
ncbi:MAG TPA: hypothetical protein VGT78_09825 [Rhizomicrobium sp.]|nr:hypothetical protein [Rhizomicrobium sp.]